MGADSEAARRPASRAGPIQTAGQSEMSKEIHTGGLEEVAGDFESHDSDLGGPEPNRETSRGAGAENRKGSTGMRLHLNIIVALTLCAASARGQDRVTIVKSQVKVVTRTFDPKKPPEEMPSLSADEAAGT